MCQNTSNVANIFNLMEQLKENEGNSSAFYLITPIDVSKTKFWMHLINITSTTYKTSIGITKKQYEQILNTKTDFLIYELDFNVSRRTMKIKCAAVLNYVMGKVEEERRQEQEIKSVKVSTNDETDSDKRLKAYLERKAKDRKSELLSINSEDFAQSWDYQQWRNIASQKNCNDINCKELETQALKNDQQQQELQIGLLSSREPTIFEEHRKDTDVPFQIFQTQKLESKSNRNSCKSKGTVIDRDKMRLQSFSKQDSTVQQPMTSSSSHNHFFSNCALGAGLDGKFEHQTLRTKLGKKFERQTLRTELGGTFEPYEEETDTDDKLQKYHAKKFNSKTSKFGGINSNALNNSWSYKRIQNIGASTSFNFQKECGDYESEREIAITDIKASTPNMKQPKHVQCKIVKNANRKLAQQLPKTNTLMPKPKLRSRLPSNSSDTTNNSSFKTAKEMHFKTELHSKRDSCKNNINLASSRPLCTLLDKNNMSGLSLEKDTPTTSNESNNNNNNEIAYQARTLKQKLIQAKQRKQKVYAIPSEGYSRVQNSMHVRFLFFQPNENIVEPMTFSKKAFYLLDPTNVELPEIKTVEDVFEIMGFPNKIRNLLRLVLVNSTIYDVLGVFLFYFFCIVYI